MSEKNNDQVGRTVDQPLDLFVVGGGVNGCGIARDAVGRGYQVALAEMNDLASATSSASTKLFHGGLRYLEFFEFRLVREALKEREVLYRNMPHISWPMRFVLPHHKDMRFEKSTPASRLLSYLFPWMKGRRPAWLIRLALFFYDHMGGQTSLPSTASLKLREAPEGKPLQARFKKAFEYSDCWVDDARLVVLNAQDAQARGAQVLVQTKVTDLTAKDGLWCITLESPDGVEIYYAKMVVNAAGPWADQVFGLSQEQAPAPRLRLVRGSHIIVKKHYDHDRCYFFQGSDGRIIFAIPYERDFTLIGTTDADHGAPDQTADCTEDERDYLIDFANQYFESPLSKEDVVWSYSGVRSLYNDGASSASATTRDYVLDLKKQEAAPILSVFGGKITTYRKLSNAAFMHIDAALGVSSREWTHNAPLPGGDFAPDQVPELLARLSEKMPYVSLATQERWLQQYGTLALDMVAPVEKLADMGQHFGAELYQAEVDWMLEREWVRCADDLIWRRSKLGLRLSPADVSALDAYIAAALSNLSVAR